MRVCVPEAASASWACALLRRTAESQALADGRYVHDCLIRHAHDAYTLIANSLIEMYAQCGSPREARAAFDRIPHPNLFSWNALIKAYGINGLLDDARRVFCDMPVRDVVSWTALISLLAHQAQASEALHLYHQMHVEGFQPNKITFIASLHACASERSYTDGLAFHVNLIEVGCDSNVTIGTALIKMYDECGKLRMAWSVFSSMPSHDIIAWNAMIAVFAHAGDHMNAICVFRMAPERNTASWNTMIGAYMQCGNPKMALEMFHDMDREAASPSVITFVCALNACAGLVSLEDGQMIHILWVKLGVESVEVENALISMYGKCRSIREARSIFANMCSSDVISWTAIIVACTENDQIEEAIGFFREMQRKRVQADEVTFVCSLDACAMLGTLGEGRRLDDLINVFGLDDHWMVKTALIDMYGKCGSLAEAWHTFYRLPGFSVTTWNAVITTLAHNGLVEEVFALVRKMQQNDIKPNPVTFSCVLTACSHAGWVDLISRVFVSIGRDHGVAYTEDHYLCTVDIFARSGQLERAVRLIKCFPFANDEGLAWQCVLAACKVHNDQERAVQVAIRGFEVDSKNVSLYTLLSNIQCGR